jgi:hypothetical protein
MRPFEAMDTEISQTATTASPSTIIATMTHRARFSVFIVLGFLGIYLLHKNVFSFILFAYALILAPLFHSTAVRMACIIAPHTMATSAKG